MKRLIVGMTAQLSIEQAAAIKAHIEERIPDREIVVLGSAAFIHEMDPDT